MFIRYEHSTNNPGKIEISDTQFSMEIEEGKTYSWFPLFGYMDKIPFTIAEKVHLFFITVEQANLRSKIRKEFPEAEFLFIEE